MTEIKDYFRGVFRWVKAICKDLGQVQTTANFLQVVIEVQTYNITDSSKNKVQSNHNFIALNACAIRFVA